MFVRVIHIDTCIFICLTNTYVEGITYLLHGHSCKHVTNINSHNLTTLSGRHYSFPQCTDEKIEVKKLAQDYKISGRTEF